MEGAATENPHEVGSFDYFMWEMDRLTRFAEQYGISFIWCQLANDPLDGTEHTNIQWTSGNLAAMGAASRITRLVHNKMDHYTV